MGRHLTFLNEHSEWSTIEEERWEKKLNIESGYSGGNGNSLGFIKYSSNLNKHNFKDFHKSFDHLR